MGKVYQLPKAAKPVMEPLTAVKGTPCSQLYAIIKSPSGVFQVVNLSALSGSPCVVAYTAAKKDWAIDWIITNDSAVSNLNDETVRNVRAA